MCLGDGDINSQNRLLDSNVETLAMTSRFILYICLNMKQLGLHFVVSLFYKLKIYYITGIMDKYQ